MAWGETLSVRSRRMPRGGTVASENPQATHLAESRGAPRLSVPYPAKLYHLFTNISADCAPSRARVFARHSRTVRAPSRRDTVNEASDDRHHLHHSRRRSGQHMRQDASALTRGEP